MIYSNIKPYEWADTLYGIDSKKMEVAEIFFLSVINPWVKWPPSGRSRPMILPWGSTTAVYTAKFAGDPEHNTFMSNL